MHIAATRIDVVSAILSKLLNSSLASNFSL